MGNRWKSLGAKSGLYVRWSNVSQSNFATGCKSAVLCVQWGTVMEEKITVSLRRLQKVCNSSDFYGGPVFQVGHQVELPQRCSLCTCLDSHDHEHSEPSGIHMNSMWDFIKFSASNNTDCKLLFWSTLIQLYFSVIQYLSFDIAGFNIFSDVMMQQLLC